MKEDIGDDKKNDPRFHATRVISLRSSSPRWEHLFVLGEPLKRKNHVCTLCLLEGNSVVGLAKGKYFNPTNGSTHLTKMHTIVASTSSTNAPTQKASSTGQKRRPRGIESMTATTQKANSEQVAPQLVTFLTSRNLPLSLVEKTLACATS